MSLKEEKREENCDYLSKTRKDATYKSAIKREIKIKFSKDICVNV